VGGSDDSSSLPHKGWTAAGSWHSVCPRVPSISPLSSKGFGSFPSERGWKDKKSRQQSKGDSAGPTGLKQMCRKACYRNIFFRMLPSTPKGPQCEPISEHPRHSTAVNSALFVKRILTTYWRLATMPRIEACLERV